MGDLRIRPMTQADVPSAEHVSDEAFFDLDSRVRRPDGPRPSRRTPAHRSVWIERTSHLVRHDPEGCWVAEDDAGVVGVATSFRREVLWCLTTYAVVPGRQGAGVGQALLAAAMHHGRSSSRWMLSASSDAAAVRAYHRAGFHLHPQMYLAGTVDRSALPVVDKVREGAAADRDLMDSLDRTARGAGHGVDHEHMLTTWRLLVSDTATGSGYAYLDERGRLALLAANNRRTATRLLWAVLADGAEETIIGHLTGVNQWALEVGFAAGLTLGQEGFLGLRGMKPPSPYVHNGALL